MELSEVVAFLIGVVTGHILYLIWKFNYDI
jgi:hypothetical protein